MGEPSTRLQKTNLLTIGQFRYCHCHFGRQNAIATLVEKIPWCTSHDLRKASALAHEKLLHKMLMLWFSQGNVETNYIVCQNQKTILQNRYQKVIVASTRNNCISGVYSWTNFISYLYQRHQINA